MNHPESCSVCSDSRFHSAPISELAIDGSDPRPAYPLPIADRDGVQTTIAECSVFVALAADRKGTHMSRLVALLEERAIPGAAPIGVSSFRGLLETLVERLDAPGGLLELAFPFFVRKSAPVSGISSLLDYQAKLTGDIDHRGYRQTWRSLSVTPGACARPQGNSTTARQPRSLILLRHDAHRCSRRILRVGREEASSSCSAA